MGCCYGLCQDEEEWDFNPCINKSKTFNVYLEITQPNTTVKNPTQSRRDARLSSAINPKRQCQETKKHLESNQNPEFDDQTDSDSGKESITTTASAETCSLYSMASTKSKSPTHSKQICYDTTFI